MHRPPQGGYAAQPAGGHESGAGGDAAGGAAATNTTTPLVSGAASGVGVGAGVQGVGAGTQGADEGLTGLARVVRGFRDVLPGVDLEALGDGDRLDALHQLEIATRTMAAVSVQLQVAFYASQIAAQEQAGVSKGRRGRAVPDDLATARMCSPYVSSRELTAAKALCTQLPHTLAALVSGVISGYQARLVSEGTSCVDGAHRAEIDERLAPQLPGISNRELTAAVQALVYEVDPEGFVERARKAAEDRGVSMRPVPDVMALLSARLPAPQAIAVYRCLDYAARIKKLSGDPRTLQQLRADELYERCTGKQVVDGIDIEVGVVITDTALFEGTSDPAELIGYGPIPADYARELLRPHDDDSEQGAYTNPAPNTQPQPEPDTATEPAPRTDAEPEPEPEATAEPDIQPDSVEAESGSTAEAEAEAESGPTGEAEAKSSPATRSEPEAASGPTTEPHPEPDTGKRGDGSRKLPDDGAEFARRDAEANANGFAGGHAPQGHCPAGGACTDAACVLLHGTPKTQGTASTPTGSTGTTGSSGSPGSPGSPPPGPGTSPSPGGPSTQARMNALTAGMRAAKVFIRRLYTDPTTGILIGRDPRRRLFTGSLRAFLVARDKTCRNPYCGAQIRTIDHIHRHSDGGPTTPENGQGLCERCNLSRERPRALNPQADTYRPPPPLLPCFPRPTRTPGPIR